MKTVIYHSADFDGIFCREIAKKFLGEKGVNYIGWNFGDPSIRIGSITGTDIVVMDLPLDRPFGGPKPYFDGRSKDIVWIDHHKSAIETHDPETPGYRIDGVAACRLAWQWFTNIGPDNPEWDAVLPRKQDFIDRKVSEPLAVRLAGEYDIWDRKWMAEDENILRFQYGLKSYKFPPCQDLIDDRIGIRGQTLECVVIAGAYSQEYAQNMDAFWLAEAGYVLEWEGLKFLTKNTVERGSNMFLSKDVPSTGHDALLAYGFRGKLWTVSMYHAQHRPDLDLSLIAVKYGGGGHKGACGFTCSKLPFMAT